MKKFLKVLFAVLAVASLAGVVYYFVQKKKEA